MPPQLKLINRLLRAETTEAREQLLGEEPALIDGDLVDMLDALTAQFMPAEDPSMTRETQRHSRHDRATCLDSLR